MQYVKPSFGTDERRRIMDIFKEKKKSRRKKNNPNTCDSSTKTTTSTLPATELSSSEQQQLQQKDCIVKKKNEAVEGLSSSSDNITGNLHKNGNHTAGTNNKPHTSSKKKKMKDKQTQPHQSTSVPNTTNMRNKGVIAKIGLQLQSSSNMEEEGNDGLQKNKEMGISKSLQPPPGLPPGFEKPSKSSTILDPIHSNSNAMSGTTDNGTSSSNNSLLQEPSMPESSLPLSPPSATTSSNTNHSLPIPPPIPPKQIHPSYCIIIPEKDRRIQPSITINDDSLAVLAAKAFIDFYYPGVTQYGCSPHCAPQPSLSNPTMSISIPSFKEEDLAYYYTAKAQKSISIGDAHSIVTNPSDRQCQFSSLAGSRFLVRGVVAQDSYYKESSGKNDRGRGVHILVTGVVQTSALGGNGVSDTMSCAPFAHSISLVPATMASMTRTTRIPNKVVEDATAPCNHFFGSDIVPYAYHIHNDALSLLTVNDMIAPPMAVPPVMQPPPPRAASSPTLPPHPCVDSIEPAVASSVMGNALQSEPHQPLSSLSQQNHHHEQQQSLKSMYTHSASANRNLPPPPPGLF